MPYRRLFILIGALVLVEVMFYSVLAPLLPYYVRHLGISKSEAGVLSASYAVGTILFSVPSGFLVSRIGARRTVVVGVVLLAASSVAFGFIHAVAGLDAARCLQGVGGAFVWTGGLSWLVATAPAEQRGQVVGTALGVGIGGALLGPILGAAATVAGPEVVFSLIAAVIAALGCFVIALERAPQGRANTVRQLVAAIGVDSRIWAGFWFTALPSVVFGVLEVLAPLRMGALGAGAGGIAATFFVAAAIEARLSPVWRSESWPRASASASPGCPRARCCRRAPSSTGSIRASPSRSGALRGGPGRPSGRWAEPRWQRRRVTPFPTWRSPARAW